MSPSTEASDLQRCCSSIAVLPCVCGALEGAQSQWPEPEWAKQDTVEPAFKVLRGLIVMLFPVPRIHNAKMAGALYVLTEVDKSSMLVRQLPAYGKVILHKLKGSDVWKSPEGRVFQAGPYRECRGRRVAAEPLGREGVACRAPTEP